MGRARHLGRHRRRTYLQLLGLASQPVSVSPQPPICAGGAYGLRVHGIEVPAGQLIAAPEHWPAVELRVRVVPGPGHELEYVDADSARLNVRAGGTVAMDRASGVATFTLAAPPTPSALVHPHLAAVAAVWSHWAGREGFHAGAFLAGGGVWGILGDKGTGKSSTLAALASRGVPILCDDVLVLDSGAALAGPRSIDLRTDAAERLRIGEPLGVIGGRDRWRVALEPIEPELPFHGWIALRWAEKPTIRPLEGAGRLSRLLANRALLVPPRAPTVVFDLARAPFLELSRPRRWDAIDDALDRLLTAISG